MHSSSHVRAAFWIVIAVMAFFAMAASSPQCAESTQDRSLNPVFEPLANDCILQCQEDFKAEQNWIRMEFKSRKSVCNGDSACVEAAVAWKQGKDFENTETKDYCKNVLCQHQQGAATGGQ